MHISTPITSLPGALAAPTPTRRVVDAPMRMFHWLFALCFIGAYASADSERWQLLHVTLGYTLAGLLVFRLGYGVFGPRQARLSLLWHRVGGAKAWLSSLKPGAPGKVNVRQGQTLLMALALVALLAVVVPVTLSGYATYSDWGGEWLEDLHEFTGEVFLWLVLAHLGLILALSLLRRKNQALPMWTGRVEGTGPDLARRNHAWLAVVLLAAVLTFWIWQWQDSANGLLPAHALVSSHDRHDHHRHHHHHHDDD